jgi:hypothetical protein
MTMKNKLLSSCLFGISSFFSFSAHADWDFSSLDWRGSYLFCVNEYNTYNWEWAKENQNFNMFHKKGTLESSRGIWIRGNLAFNKHAAPVLDVNHTFETVKEANEFCDALVNQCKSLDDSKKFALVGVASYSIPYSSWGLVSVKYKSGEKIVISGKEEDKLKTSSCQNWNYKEFPNEGGAYLTLGKLYR